MSGDSGTLRVRAEFDNPDGLLTPGLFARIRLGSAEKTTAVLVNDKAIGTDQTRRYVYALDDNGMVGYRPVTLGKLTDRVTQAAYLDETALVTLPGGAQARVRNPLAAGQGDVVYVQDGAVIGQAPA